MDFEENKKQIFRNVKAIDERRSKCTSVTQLLSRDVSLREKLIELIESIILCDFDTNSKKIQSLLWRKVYYETIAGCKKFWRRSGSFSEEDLLLLKRFIDDAIRHYKTLILKFENIFSLDIRSIVNFTIIAEGADAFERTTENEIYTTKEMSHAIETIHAFLISLGDLHRYCIEFKFIEDKSSASKYYWEAFKLIPNNGKPHNQLGTLFAGENFELQSIFHYLYSLCLLESGDESIAPLSEANINKIFQMNIEALEQDASNAENFSTKEFVQNIILIIDIFFYDKEIEQFNSLCFSALNGFKEYLNRCQRNSLYLSEKVVFLLTSIFMLCLFKLKLKKSAKIHNLNAFLIAFCAEILDKSIESIERFLDGSSNENEIFEEMYSKKYQTFERQIKHAREIKSQLAIRKGSTTKENSSLSQEGHVLSSDHHSQSQTVKILKRSQEEEKKPTIKGDEKKGRRRRKRRSSSTSSSDDESIASDISMNSDFDSFDEDDDDSVRFSSDDSSDQESNKDDQNDDADFFIENEELVYVDNSDIVIEEERMVFKEEQTDEEISKLLKIRYKKRYNKVNPNLILRHCQINSSWLQSLEILFDWLHLNGDILLDCYRTNPEFIKKIMTLLNHINIDIFTRKIYFERSMITFKNVRENMRVLFDMRHKIPTEADNIFKKFPLFRELQETIDWKLNYQFQITPEEDVIVRTFKMVDFGYFLCKQKKFNYNFCARSRVFIEKKSNSSRPQFGRKDRGGRPRRRNRKRRERLDTRPEKELAQTESETEEIKSTASRKGYLKNKGLKAEAKSLIEEKSEMMEKMGKLWLKNEVDSLELRSKPENGNLTPYLMVDTLGLINNLHIVKNLLKSKKFVLLIPKAVLQDIDGLKKSKDSARNAIKWLEAEFQKGNRFMRVQHTNECLPLPFLKVPTKLEREDTVFMNIVPFINFIVSNNSNDVENELPLLTLLTGENLDAKKSSVINKVGILQSIPVKYEQINRFYLKYKK